MSDHDTWNMFLAHAFAARVAANSDYPLSDAADDADRLLEMSKKRAEAEAAEYKAELRRVINGEPAEPTPPQPDDDGWIKWEGGECPVPPTTIVRALLRCGDEAGNAYPGSSWDWMHSDSAFDIVAYKRVSK